jgi:hypothetical protein
LRTFADAWKAVDATNAAAVGVHAPNTASVNTVNKPRQARFEKLEKTIPLWGGRRRMSRQGQPRRKANRSLAAAAEYEEMNRLIVRYEMVREAQVLTAQRLAAANTVIAAAVAAANVAQKAYLNATDNAQVLTAPPLAAANEATAAAVAASTQAWIANQHAIEAAETTAHAGLVAGARLEGYADLEAETKQVKPAASVAAAQPPQAPDPLRIEQ